MFMWMFVLILLRRPPLATRTDTLCPYTTHFLFLLQVGYWFGRAYWGHVYATETLGALLGFLDERTREPIHAAVHPDNAASRSVLENNGFVCLNRWLSDMLEYRRQR